ncbi:MAG: type II toxin-antitoxin system RelE family toxin [Dehalococcoidia bacterium]
MSAREQPVFEVRLRSKRVQRELDALKGVDYDRVIARLRSLANNPRPPGCEKLYDAVYRFRIGGFRIIYRVDQESRRIDIGAVRRRSERTYTRIRKLFE